MSDDFIAWNPRVGDEDDERYHWPQTIPAKLAGPFDLYSDPPTLEEVNEGSGLNQIIAECNRQRPWKNDWIENANDGPSDYYPKMKYIGEEDGFFSVPNELIRINDKKSDLTFTAYPYWQGTSWPTENPYTLSAFRNKRIPETWVFDMRKRLSGTSLHLTDQTLLRFSDPLTDGHICVTRRYNFNPGYGFYTDAIQDSDSSGHKTFRVGVKRYNSTTVEFKRAFWNVYWPWMPSELIEMSADPLLILSSPHVDEMDRSFDVDIYKFNTFRETLHDDGDSDHFNEAFMETSKTQVGSFSTADLTQLTEYPVRLSGLDYGWNTLMFKADIDDETWDESVGSGDVFYLDFATPAYYVFFYWHYEQLFSLRLSR